MNFIIATGGNKINVGKEKIDVLVLRRNCDVSAFLDSDIDVCIYERENLEKVRKLNSARNLVSCGMHDFDSVTFSSMSDSCAMMCIRRTISFSTGKTIIPCEIKSTFDNKVSIYDNLVKSLLLYISEL